MRLGFARPPGEVQEDQADRCRREQGEGQERHHGDDKSRMVTHQNHGGSSGERPRLLQDSDGGCLPRTELLHAGGQLLADARAGSGLIPASPLPGGKEAQGDSEQNLEYRCHCAAVALANGAVSADRIGHSKDDDEGDAPPDKESGGVDPGPGSGKQQDEHDNGARGHAGEQAQQNYRNHQAHLESRFPASRPRLVMPDLGFPRGWLTRRLPRCLIYLSAFAGRRAAGITRRG